MDLETQKESWGKWGDYEFYKIFTCPGRPSRDDVRHYNRLVKKALGGRMNPEILILGCTPELRDMMLKYSLLQKAQITCVDMSINMWKTMNRFTESNNRKNETFIRDSWVTMRLKKKFDIILGDYVVNNIDLNLKEEFLGNIADHLKKNGCFIIRDFVIDKKYKRKELSQWLRGYIKPLLEEEMTMKEAVNWVENELLVQSWFFGNEGRVSLAFWEKDVEEFRKKIEKEGNANPVLREFFRLFYSNFLMIKDKYWTPMEEEEEKIMLSNFFIFKETLYSSDYSPLMIRTSPIYRLIKK